MWLFSNKSWFSNVGDITTVISANGRMDKASQSRVENEAKRTIYYKN